MSSTLKSRGCDLLALRGGIHQWQVIPILSSVSATAHLPVFLEAAPAECLLAYLVIR